MTTPYIDVSRWARLRTASTDGSLPPTILRPQHDQELTPRHAGPRHVPVRRPERQQVLQDIRFALRTLRRSPSFTLVVIATLGLGIGINTAIFSLVNGVLLRPLPYDQPERVMTLWEANPQLGIPQDRVAAGTYRDWTERAESFADLGAYSFETFILGDATGSERISGARVSPSVFDVVGVQPMLGRSFREEEATAGNDFVVILSNGFWTQRFGADPEVIGTAIVLDDEPFTIVGVTPPRFEFPPDAEAVRMWRPLAIRPP